VSDFLSNLVERSLAATVAVRPQLFSVFEPRPVNGGGLFRGPEGPALPALDQRNQDPADRISRLQSLWPTNPEAAAEFVAATSKPGLTSPESTELPSVSPQVRPRDLPRKQQSAAPSKERRETADAAKTGEECAGALRPQLSSVHEPAISTSASESVFRDSTRNPPCEPRAEKIVEMIPRGRDSHRELTQVRDVNAVSPRPPSRRSLTLVQQPKSPPAAPSINVNIGRIEVRATLPPASAKTQRPAAPILSLDEYLHQRAGGNRR
jgi:hypothetical protein